MPTGGSAMPAPTTYAGGVQGYSAYPMYQQSVDALQQANPGQYDAIMAQFIDPVRGGSFGAAMPAVPTAPAPAAPAGWAGYNEDVLGPSGWGA